MGGAGSIAGGRGGTRYGEGGVYSFEVNDTSLTEHGIEPGDTIRVEFTSEVRDGELYIVRLGNNIVSRYLYRQDERLKVVSAAGHSEVREAAAVDVVGRIVR